MKWQPIKTAPKNQEILVTDGYRVFTAKYSISNCSHDEPYFATSANSEFINLGYDWKLEKQYIQVTHWMPLPKPPKEKQNDKTN